MGVPTSWASVGVVVPETSARRQPTSFDCNENSVQLDVAPSYHCSDEAAP